MDRNSTSFQQISAYLRVALRKESVDRNLSSLEQARCLSVALRKESVDRNYEEVKPKDFYRAGRSPQGERG